MTFVLFVPFKFLLRFIFFEEDGNLKNFNDYVRFCSGVVFFFFPEQDIKLFKILVFYSVLIFYINKGFIDMPNINMKDNLYKFYYNININVTIIFIYLFSF